MENSLNDRYPEIGEISEQYVSLRRAGHNRASALAKLEADYAAELHDPDDGPVIRIALALALCKKRELTKDIQQKAIYALGQLNVSTDSDRVLAGIHKKIAQEAMLGDEARYRPARRYTPDWEIGDIFAHRLSLPLAAKSGILGWYVLIRKVGSYTDINDKEIQLAYLTLCPPDSLPASTEELDRLGLLVMMPHDNYNDYLAQIPVHSRKGEELFELTRVGCFPDAAEPSDKGPSDPQTAMPIFSTRGPDGVPGYEQLVCLCYKKYGITKQ